MGGSSRIPRVRKLLEDKFGREKVVKKSALIPGHAIALGAAIVASDVETKIIRANI